MININTLLLLVNSLVSITIIVLILFQNDNVKNSIKTSSSNPFEIATFVLLIFQITNFLVKMREFASFN